MTHYVQDNGSECWYKMMTVDWYLEVHPCLLNWPFTGLGPSSTFQWRLPDHITTLKEIH